MIPPSDRSSRHSTMSYDEVRRMILTCPGVGAIVMLYADVLSGLIP